MAPPEPTDAAPLRIGRYEVISHLATGGMAQIYLARQTGLGSFERHVVLKTILRERANDRRFVTMFLDEAKLAATLNHQNIAQVYEVDQADGAYFMAMEYVHGENTRAILETTIRRNWTIPLELAVMIISGAAAGLHHAHERRGKNGQPLHIVHRDVSPANVMVGYDGSVKVLDFGIAKAEERATQTVGGTIKGKYGYMSPEQCKGKPIDRRSDIFALGIVLYELTTLRRAFKGNDDFETMKRIVAGDLVLPSTIIGGFPRELEAIILTALAIDPGARFQTAQELIEALDAFTVRAKLTGTNTAMGRFMLQLFGTKKEPWIDATLQSTDHTLVTPAELDDYEDDNDETQVLGDRQDVQRVLAEIDLPRQARAPTGPLTRTAAPHTATQLVVPPPEIPARPSPLPERARRPSVRRDGVRPSLPFATPAPQITERSATSGAVLAQPAPAVDRNRSSNPNLASTLIGPVPVTPEPAAAAKAASSTPMPVPPMPMPPVTMPPATMPPTPMPMPPGAMPTPAGAMAMPPGAPVPVLPPGAVTIVPMAPSGLPKLVSSSDDVDPSQIGARPLVTDPKLGWSTSVKVPPPIDGNYTRLASEQVDFRIKSNTRWVFLAVGLVLIVVVLVILIITT